MFIPAIVVPPVWAAVSLALSRLLLIRRVHNADIRIFYYAVSVGHGSGWKRMDSQRLCWRRPWFPYVCKAGREEMLQISKRYDKNIKEENGNIPGVSAESIGRCAFITEHVRFIEAKAAGGISLYGQQRFSCLRMQFAMVQ